MEARMRSIVAAVVGCVALVVGAWGCSDAAVDPPSADAGSDVDSATVQYDSSRGESLAPDDPSRLVRGAQSYQDLDGKAVELADGWRDTKRNEVCAPFESTDGRIRCLPLAATAVWRSDLDLVYRYADAECNGARKAVLVPATTKVEPKYLRAPYRSDTTQYEVHVVKKAAQRDYYVFDHCVRGRDGGTDADASPTIEIDSGACGQCVRVTAPVGTDVYTSVEEIRPGEFGSFSVY